MKDIVLGIILIVFYVGAIIFGCVVLCALNPPLWIRILSVVLIILPTIDLTRRITSALWVIRLMNDEDDDEY